MGKTQAENEQLFCEYMINFAKKYKILEMLLTFLM